MDNASEALIMAGQILIFIVALSVCISSYSTLRAGIDNVITQTETIQFAKDTEGYINFIESKNDDATRIVGAETVISSMYRAIKEDFTMYLKLKDDTFTGVKAVLESNIDNYEVKFNYDEKSIKITISNDANYRSHSLLKNGLYEKIKDKKFKEFLGEYQEKTNDGVSSENKQTKRIITYEEI